MLLWRELSGASVIWHLFVVRRNNSGLVTESFGVASANKRFQVKFFPLKCLRSELRQQCESGFVLAMWHRLRGCRALGACLQRLWLLPGHKGREQEQAPTGAAALQLTVFVLLGQGGDWKGWG